jgi:hypothetical protein
MHKDTIKAYAGIGKNRRFVGEKTVEIPDTLEDAIKLEKGDKNAVLAGYVSSYRIAIQRGIRGPKEMSEAERAFKALPQAEQDRLIKQAKAGKPATTKVKRRRAGKTEEVTVTPPVEATQG